jgi:hypothetical protein
VNAGVTLAAFILSFRPDCKGSYYVPESKPISEIAQRYGIAQSTMIRWCKLGRVRGAVMNPSTREWSVFPPCHLVDQRGVFKPWPDKK